MARVFITYRQLSDLGIRYTRKHLLELMRTGQFPQAHQLTKNRVAWDQNSISEWLNSRPVARMLAKQEAA